MKISIITLTILSFVMSAFVNAAPFDPMAPPGQQPGDNLKEIKKVKRQYQYNLRQIVISEKGNTAIINGYVLQVGEYINRSKVVKIETNKVTLEKSGRLSVIRLNKPINKVRQ